MGPIKFGTPKGNSENEIPVQKTGGMNKRNIRQRVNIKPQKYQQGYEMGNNQQMEMQQIDPQNSNRTTAIEQIENALHDISGLFKKFGTIVAQHETLVERID